jgi:molecular chaperone GrpE
MEGKNELMENEKNKVEDQKTADGIDPLVGDAEAGLPDQASELMKLREQIAAKEKESKEHYDRYLRQVAELENFRKRTKRERDEGIRFANEGLIRDLLPILDNLERAMAHSKDGGNGKPLVEGVEMVLKGLLDVLAKHGLIQVSAVGEPFDPGKHEAMAQIETESYAPNTIVEEHHKGYWLRDRLLRPALVTVAKTGKSQEKKNDDSQVENGPGDD